jgi:hypothetical protein
MALKAPQFIGWSTPLAKGVASCLIEGGRRLRGPEAPKGLPIDLGSDRVIVPSSFASRLTQEELAKQAPNGVLLPVFQTPTEFLNWGDKQLRGHGVNQGLQDLICVFAPTSSADALTA